MAARSPSWPPPRLGTSGKLPRLERPAARSVSLEELYGALVALRGGERLEGTEISPLPRARVLLARVEAELARLELRDHVAKLRIPGARRTAQEDAGLSPTNRHALCFAARMRTRRERNEPMRRLALVLALLSAA